MLEYLVSVLSEMCHEPDWSVILGLKMQNGQVEQLQLSITADNRKLIREFGAGSQE